MAAEYTYRIVADGDLSALSRAVATLGTNVERMASRVDKNAKASEAAFERMTSTVQGGATLLKSALAGLGILAAANEMRALMSASIETTGEIARMADTLGLPAERFGALTTVGREFAVTADDLWSAMGDLQQRAVNLPKDFERWGISTRDANGQMADAEVLLERVADRMRAATTETERLAIADELMSDQGRRLVPVLRQGGAALRALADEAIASGRAMTEFEITVGQQLSQTLRTTQTQAQGLGAALTGAVGPAILAVTQRTRSVLRAMTEWVRANTALIESGIQEFLIWTADNALPAIATGALLVTRAWSGWKTIIQGTELLGAALFETMTGGFAQMMTLAARAARVLGREGFARELEGTATIHRSMAAGFARDQDAIRSEIFETERAQVALEDRIGEMGISGSTAVRAISARIRELRTELAQTQAPNPLGTRLGPRDDAAATGEDPEIKRLKAQLEYESRLFRLREELRRNTREADNKALEEQREQIEANLQAFQSMAQTVTGQVGNAIGGVLSGTQSVADAITGLGQMVLDMIARQLVELTAAKAAEAAVTKTTAATNVAANAASAAAGAASSQAGIPIVGPVLAVAAMGAIFGAVIALLDGFHQGGVVGGGATGANRDAVLIAATTGEAVVDRRTTYALRSLVAGESAARLDPETTASLQRILGVPGGTTLGESDERLVRLASLDTGRGLEASAPTIRTPTPAAPSPASPALAPTTLSDRPPARMEVSVLALPESRTEIVELARRLERARQRLGGGLSDA